MGTDNPLRWARQALAGPLKRYLDARFDALESRVDAIPARVSVLMDPLRALDVSEHNAGASPPTFDRVVSQVVSATQFTSSDFLRLRDILYPSGVRVATAEYEDGELHRKVWEYVYVLRAAEQYGLLKPERGAVGFGVGTEPLPAALARYGMEVVATDQGGTEPAAESWVATGQHMSGLEALSNPGIVADDVLARLVRTRTVDMNAIPDDLGQHDLVWSCCALEHLGSPRAGLDFVLETLQLLKPGGVAVHTTELELTRRAQTADYGNLAVYRLADLERLISDIRDRGFEIDANWYVSLETAEDRFVCPPPYALPHLKLLVGDSVTTSVGLIVRRPRPGGAAPCVSLS